MKYLLLFIVCLNVLLLSNKVESATFLLNADKCVTIACGFQQLFNAGANLPKEIDDVVVYTTNTAVQAIINLTQNLSVRNLNISSGSLVIGASASLNVISQLIVGEGASLTCSSNCKISNLLTIKGSLIVDGGSTVIDGNCNSPGSLVLKKGLLEIVSLNIPSTAQIAPVILGGILKLTGISSIGVAVQVKGDAKIIIDSGITTFTDSLQCLENSLLVITAGQLSLTGQIDSVLNNILVIGAKGILSIQDQSLICLGGISTDILSNIFVEAGGILSLSGTSNILCSLNLNDLAHIIIKSGKCTLSNLITSTNKSLIEVQATATLIIKTANSITSNIDILSPLTIDAKATLQIISGKISLVGQLVTQTGSLIEILGGSCSIPGKLEQIINSNVNIAAQALLDIKGTLSILGNLNCAKESILSIASDGGLLNLGGINSILNILNLQGTSGLTILEGAKCTIYSVIKSIDSKINLDDAAHLIIQTGTKSLSNLILAGSSILSLNGDNIINNLSVLPVDQIYYPTLNFLNCLQCKLTGNIDQFGLLNLIATKLIVVADVDLVLTNNLLVDINSSILVEANAAISVNGIGSGKSIIDSLLEINGDIYLGGVVNLNGGIKTSNNSNCKFEDAIISINAPSIFGNLVNIIGTGSLHISANIDILNGFYVLPPSFPITFDSNIINIFSQNPINSLVKCLACTIKTAVNSTIDLGGGLITDGTSLLHVVTSTLTLGGNSTISGNIILELGSKLYTEGYCTIVKAIKSISQYDKDNITNHNINNPSSNEHSNSVYIHSGECKLFGAILDGEIEVFVDASLNILAPVQCLGGVRNSGKIIIDSLINSTNNLIIQTSSDASCILNKGSQLIAGSINIGSGLISGVGKIITKNGLTCGGITNGVFDIVGDFRLLDSSVLRIIINSLTDYSNFKVSARAYLAGMVEVKVNVKAGLHTADSVQILKSSHCDGKLFLTDSSQSQGFLLRNTTTAYNLVYQNSKESNKTAQEESGNFSNQLQSSIFMVIVMLLLSLFMY